MLLPATSPAADLRVAVESTAVEADVDAAPALSVPVVLVEAVLARRP